MSKHKNTDRTKNRTRKQQNYAVLMAMCIVAGIGSVVIGAMNSNPAVLGVGTVSAGIGLSAAYSNYQSLNSNAKRSR